VKVIIDEKIMQKALAFRKASDKGEADYADKITESVLYDEALTVWQWNAAIRQVKRCGIYNAYYITEDCPYCNPDLVRIAEQLARAEDYNADTIGAPEPDEPRPEPCHCGCEWTDGICAYRRDDHSTALAVCVVAYTQEPP
jgi:hypothetical protein